MTQGKIPSEHQDQLHDQLRGLANRVWTYMSADYGDACGGVPHNRSVFRAHYPELAADLDRWDNAVARYNASRSLLTAAFTDLAARRGLSTDVYEWDPLVNTVSEFLFERAKAGNIGVPFALPWSLANNDGVSGPGLGPGREVRLGDIPVAHLAAQPASTARKLCESVRAPVDEVATAVADGPEAVEIMDSFAAVATQRRELWDKIDSWQKVTVRQITEDCLTCRRNLGLPAESANSRGKRRWLHIP